MILLRMEGAVKASNLDWTILRPPRPDGQAAHRALSRRDKRCPPYPRRYRPNMLVCILLADHWGINPNELLMLADWPKLKAFNIHTESATHLPPGAVQVAKEIARIPNPGKEEDGGRGNIGVGEEVF